MNTNRRRSKHGRKYTNEVLSEAAAASCSVYGVMRRLEMKLSGGNHSHIKKMMVQFGIDTSHFTGVASNRGPNHRGGCTKLSWQEVLVFDRYNGRREDIKILRRAFLDSGVLERCSECGIGPEWNERHLRLQIDHKDGNYVDNRRENLRFLCPNCHTQTETFGSKNHSRAKVSDSGNQNL